MMFKTQFQALENAAVKIVKQSTTEAMEVLKDEKKTVTEKRTAITTLQESLKGLDDFYEFAEKK